MLRLIAILVVAVLLWLVLRAALAAAARLAAPPPQQRSASSSTATIGERLVACTTCGVRIPESRAVRGSGSVYCSTDCRAGADRAEAG